MLRLSAQLALLHIAGGVHIRLTPLRSVPVQTRAWCVAAEPDPDSSSGKVEAAQEAQKALHLVTEEANEALAEAAQADLDLESAIVDEEKALVDVVEAVKEVVDEAASTPMEEGTVEEDALGAAASAAIERAEARVVAREETAWVPTVQTPPPQAASSSSPRGGVLDKSSLPPVLAEAFETADLLDPTTLSPVDRDSSLGAIAVGALVVFVFPVFEAGFIGDLLASTLIGGGLAGYLSLRKDEVGSVVREKLGSSSNKAAAKAYEKAVEIEAEYQIMSKTKKKATELMDEVQKKIKDTL
jgi:hypothetical protein